MLSHARVIVIGVGSDLIIVGLVASRRGSSYFHGEKSNKMFAGNYRFLVMAVIKDGL